MCECASVSYNDGSIDFSPTVGKLRKNQSILKWILQVHDGKVPDVQNLLRAACHHHIVYPLSLSKAEVEARLVACMSEIYGLQRQAPAL